MPTILTYFDDPGFFDYPFDDPAYLKAYYALAAAVAARGANFSVARGADTYKGKMTFSSAWKYVDGKFCDVQSPIKADLIYMKGNNLRSGKRDRIINPAGLGAACGMDKHRTYEVFPEHFPTTVEVETQTDLENAVNGMKTPMVVIKPDSGFGGKNVFIGSKATALLHDHQYPAIVQEFIDTSHGIPGITSSYHDLRILVMDGRIFMTFLRVPAKGKLLSNVSQGGTMTIIPEHMRPRETDRIVADIDEKMTVFEHRFYSIDCGLDATGTWYVFELNDQPGLLTPEECGPYTQAYYDGIADYLVACANE